MEDSGRAPQKSPGQSVRGLSQRVTKSAASLCRPQTAYFFRRLRLPSAKATSRPTRGGSEEMRRTAAFGGSGTDTGGSGAGSAGRAGLGDRTLSGLLSGRKAGFSTLTAAGLSSLGAL